MDEASVWELGCDEVQGLGHDRKRVQLSGCDEVQGSDETRAGVSDHDGRRARVSSGYDETPGLGSGCAKADCR